MTDNQDNQSDDNQVQENSVPSVPSAPEPTPDATLEKAADDTAAPSSASPPPELPDSKASLIDSKPPISPPSQGSPDTPDDLINLKQAALKELSPLISHLDQTPEESFRTTMMMIQATDDPSKIKEAYEAARKISDDKVRAQALLDIVNEINYFTQQNKEK